MMKKNTILKILSFVLVLTMVVAAVLLTGCNNKTKEDLKATQDQLDETASALKAAEDLIAEIQKNLADMKASGTATAEELAAEQAKLAAAEAALAELQAQAVTPEDIAETNEMLYGDGEFSLTAFVEKVTELADAKALIVDYYPQDIEDLRVKFLGEHYAQEDPDFYKGWYLDRLVNNCYKVATVKAVFAAMEAEFEALVPAVDRFDAELEALTPDANGGKLVLPAELDYSRADKLYQQTYKEIDGEKKLVNQLYTINALYDYITATANKDKLHFNGTEEEVEAKKAARVSLIEAYAVLVEVKKADDGVVAKQGEEDWAGANGTAITQPASEEQEEQEEQEEPTTVKKLGLGIGIDKEMVYIKAAYDKNNDIAFEYYDQTNKDVKKYAFCVSVDEDDTQYTFADVFSEGFKYSGYFAGLTLEDLPGFANYVAKRDRYIELDNAMKALKTLKSELTTFKSLKKSNLDPTINQYDDVVADGEKLDAWKAEYSLLEADKIVIPENADLESAAYHKIEAKNKKIQAANDIKNENIELIFTAADGEKRVLGANYAAVVNVREIAKKLKAIKTEFVDAKVKGTSNDLRAQIDVVTSVKQEKLLWTDREMLKDVYDKYNNIKGKLSGDWYNNYERCFREMLGVESTSKIEAALERYEDMAAAAEAIKAKDEYLTGVDGVASKWAHDAGEKEDLEGKVTSTRIQETTKKQFTVVWDCAFTDSKELTETLPKAIAKILADYEIYDGDNYKGEVAEANRAAMVKDFEEHYAYALQAFEAKKAPLAEAYNTVKEVLYKVEDGKLFTLDKDVLYKVDDDNLLVKYYRVLENNEWKDKEDKDAWGLTLADLKALLWAQSVVDKAENAYPSDKAKFAQTDDDKSGQFIIDTIVLDEEDEDEKVTVRYGDFRTLLNNLVSAVKTKANAAEADAAVIRKLIADAKLATYTSLNQNAPYAEAYDLFTKWCVKYLGASLAYEVEEKRISSTALVPKDYTPTEFYATVKNYFVQADETGSNKGILNVQIGKASPLAFITTANFEALETAELASATLYDQAAIFWYTIKASFKPAMAIGADAETMNRNFVEYVQTYYGNHEDLVSVNDYYKILTQAEFTKSTTKVSDKLSKETYNEKAVRYASYIKNATEYFVDPSKTKATDPKEEDLTVYNELIKAFNDKYYAINTAVAEFEAAKVEYAAAVKASADAKTASENAQKVADEKATDYAIAQEATTAAIAAGGDNPTTAQQAAINIAKANEAAAKEAYDNATKANLKAMEAWQNAYQAALTAWDNCDSANDNSTWNKIEPALDAFVAAYSKYTKVSVTVPAADNATVMSYLGNIANKAVWDDTIVNPNPTPSAEPAGEPTGEPTGEPAGQSEPQ